MSVEKMGVVAERLGRFRWGLNWRLKTEYGWVEMSTVTGYDKIVWGTKNRAVRVGRRMIERDEKTRGTRRERFYVEGDNR